MTKSPCNVIHRENLPSCLPDILPTYFYSTGVNMRVSSVTRERSGRPSEDSSTAIQDETLTGPVGDYVVFIDGRKVSFIGSNELKVISKFLGWFLSFELVSELSGVWTLQVHHLRFQYSGKSRMVFFSAAGKSLCCVTLSGTFLLLTPGTFT